MTPAPVNDRMVTTSGIPRRTTLKNVTHDGLCFIERYTSRLRPDIDSSGTSRRSLARLPDLVCEELR